MTIEVREIANYLIGIHIDNHNVTDLRQIWHYLQVKQKCRIATVGQVIQTIWNILLITFLSKRLHRYVVTQNYYNTAIPVTIMVVALLEKIIIIVVELYAA